MVRTKQTARLEQSTGMQVAMKELPPVSEKPPDKLFSSQESSETGPLEEVISIDKDGNAKVFSGADLSQINTDGLEVAGVYTLPTVEDRWTLAGPG